MSWIEDVTALVFGTDEEKERAFYNPYGVPALAPLSVVTPPSARFVLAPMKALMSGDWESFQKYVAWTYVPFGRLGRDVYKSWDNPVMIPENIVGMPFHRLQQIANKKEKDAIKYWENKDAQQKTP